MKLEIIKEHEPIMGTTYFHVYVDGKFTACSLTESDAHEKIKKIKSGLTRTNEVIYTEEV